MNDETRAGSLWDRTYQVGVVVRDIAKAARFYERLGIGPFVEGPSAAALERRVYGRLQPDVSVRGLIARMGPIELELMQPVSGGSIQREFLETRGEGVIHLCAHTDDLERDVASLRAQGFEVISSASLSDGGKFAYLDTREVGGLILELFEPGPRWR